MAWLHAVPEGWSESRFETLRLADYEPEMPELYGYGVLVQHLQEIGFARSGANGYIPLTFGDIRDWLHITDRTISPAIGLMLVNLSRAYCSQANESRLNIPAPFGGIDYAVGLANVHTGNKAQKALKGNDGR